MCQQHPEIAPFLDRLGLTVLSCQVRDNHSPSYTLRCSAGHVLQRSLTSLRIGYGCKTCENPHHRPRRAFTTLDDLAELAAAHGGLSLHTGPIRRRAALLWQCGQGHTFHARADNVKAGTWCKECGDRANWTWERLSAALQGRGIKCVSDPADLTSNKSRLSWECTAGHRWQCQLVNVVFRQSGCPYCKHKAERFCREVFEDVFGAAFPKKRPEWLTFVKGKPLELDGFAEALGIAFEYQGIHHYEEVTYFQHDRLGLQKVEARDAWKRQQCRQRGIVLMQVPRYPKDCFLEADFKAYIRAYIQHQFSQTGPYPSACQARDAQLRFHFLRKTKLEAFAGN